MDIKIKIDKGFPLPPLRGYEKYPWYDMEVGDSFFVKCDVSNYKKTQSQLSGSAVYQGKRLNTKYTVRQAVDGIRVWRTL